MSPMKETKNAAAAEYQAVEPSAPPAATGVPVSTGIPVHTANPMNATGTPQVVQNTTQQVVNVNLTTPRVYYTVSWSTGLFDCADDIESCCITLWCPCVTFGMIAEVVDKGTTPCVVGASIYTLIAFLSGCQCMYSCFYRTKLRAQYGLPESPCADCCVHCCCEACALCQNYRELKNRGFDMYIGYQANMKRKQSNAVTQPPVVQTGMIR